MKKAIIIIILFFTLTACNSTKNEALEETTTQAEETTQTINKTTEIPKEPLMLSTTVGGTIDLQANKKYVFGIDIVPGTYRAELGSSDGMVNEIATITPYCDMRLSSKSGGNVAHETVGVPTVYEEGFSLEVIGEVNYFRLILTDESNIGFDQDLCLY